MKTFVLKRLVDVSGVSGTGVVAEGICYNDGHVNMHWLGKIHSSEDFENIEDLLTIHGHEGKTVVQWVWQGDGNGGLDRE